MFKKVIKNTSLMSSGVLTSRILGYIRDIILAYFFGASAVLEAFLVAFRLPNLFRSIFAEGFSDSVATPVLSEYHDDKSRLFELGNHVFSLFWVVLSVFTVLGVIFSRQLVGLIAFGWHADPVRFELAVSFTRITFVYLLMIGVSSNITSILYVRRLFFVPAFNPVFLNVTFIPGVIFFTKYFPTYILVFCVLVAGLLEVIFPLIFLKREGFFFKFDIKAALRDSQILRMFKLFLPRVWSSINYQLSVFVDTILSSWIAVVGTGGVAALYYANRFIQLPFALVALSLAQVVVVDFSIYHKDGKIEEFKKLFIFSFQSVLLLIIPVSMLYVFLSRAIIDVFYCRGAFGPDLIVPTADFLLYCSLGLTLACLNKLMTTCFYALKDTATPAKATTVTLLVNTAASIALMFPLKVGGIGLGTSIAGLVNFVILYKALVKQVGSFDWQDTREQLFKILSLSLIMALAAEVVWFYLPYNRYVRLSAALLSALVIFIAAGRLWNLKPLDRLWKRD